MTPPDSGEREVCGAIYAPMECMGIRGHLPVWDHRWRHGGLVVLHESFAQRILAALESVPWDSRTDELNAAEVELRAIVERKP